MEKSEIKAFIAKRCAKELKDGDVVNLGIGLPTMIPSYLPEGVELSWVSSLPVLPPKRAMLTMIPTTSSTPAAALPAWLSAAASLIPLPTSA